MLGPLSRFAPAPLPFLVLAGGACSSPPTAPTSADARALTNHSPGQLERRWCMAGGALVSGPAAETGGGSTADAA